LKVTASDAVAGLALVAHHSCNGEVGDKRVAQEDRENAGEY